MAIDEPAQQLYIEQLQRDIRRLDGRIDNLATTLAVSPTNEVRELDTPFLISNEHYTLVIYTIELETTSSLLNPEDVTVTLLTTGDSEDIDQVQNEIFLFSEQLLGLSINLNTKSNQHLITIISPGDYVKLVKSGDGNVVVKQSVELVLK